MTNEKNMTSSIPWDLNRLRGFDFMKFTQTKDIGEGKKDLFMSLEGQKTWFRLACPNGGLVLNALRVTDAMAIFEARVFADANDRNPLASSTATKKADKATGDAYIRAAQDAALGEALKSAGFCLQVSVLAHIARDARSAQVEGGVQPAEAPEEVSKPSPAPAQTDAPKLKEGQQPVTAVSQPKSVADTTPVQGAPEQKAGDNSPPPVDKANTPPKPDTAPRPAPVDPQPHAAVAPQPNASVEPRPAPVAPDPRCPGPGGQGRRPGGGHQHPPARGNGGHWSARSRNPARGREHPCFRDACPVRAGDLHCRHDGGGDHPAHDAGTGPDDHRPGRHLQGLDAGAGGQGSAAQPQMAALHGPLRGQRAEGGGHHCAE